MSRPTTALKDLYKDQDIWVLGAASSMNFVDPSFFQNKITVGLNQVYRKFPCNFVIMKDLGETSRFSESVEELKTLNIPLVFSEFHAGHFKSGRNKVNYDNSYMFQHNDNGDYRLKDGSLDLRVIGTDKLIAIRSTITSATNLAAYMGAKNIIVCGNDGGTIDGKTYYDGYTQDHWKSAGNNPSIKKWLRGIEQLNIEIKNKISEVYGCNIYSLNPFWNFNFEGHKYKSL